MISVIMPAYNGERFVAQAIESILSQTFQDFELIVVDDGSTDNTLEIIKQYAKQDNRIRVIQSEHGGIGYALNIGIRVARYPWIARMDQDDIAMPLRLENQLVVAENNPSVAAWGAYAYHLNEQGEVLGLAKSGPVSEEEFLTLRRNCRSVFVIHPTLFMSKSIAFRAGLYDPKSWAEDIEFYDRVAEIGPILAIPEPLLFYRIHTSSITTQNFLRIKMVTRYVRERQRARVEGNCLPTFDEYVLEYKNVPLRKRLCREIDDRSQLYYRRFAVAVANKQYARSLLFFFLSTIFNPKYTLLRAWKQRFSGEARDALKTARAGPELDQI